MRIAYLDCASGISGDMTLGALVDAGVSLEAIYDGVKSLGLPNVNITAKLVFKNGFRATQVSVEHPPEHAHRHLSQILKMIAGSGLTPSQQNLANRIFQRIGEAEAKVHGVPVAQVHFHEVGAIDSIADICGAAIGWDLLQVDRIVASPIPTGTGTVQIAHGRCSIPAPATSELLRGIPLADCSIAAELTTPTGAAIVAELAQSFGPLPAMTMEQIGYGAGQMDLHDQPNVLRLIVGTAAVELDEDTVWVLETNLDDVTGEVIGQTVGQLLDAGALDVYTSPIQMKKNRPGVLLTVLCGATECDRMEAILFRETRTLGIRRFPCGRHKIRRIAHRVQTPWGLVAGKVAFYPDEPPTFSPEADACQTLAQRHHLPWLTIHQTAIQSFHPDQLTPAAPTPDPSPSTDHDHHSHDHHSHDHHSHDHHSHDHHSHDHHSHDHHEHHHH